MLKQVKKPEGILTARFATFKSGKRQDRKTAKEFKGNVLARMVAKKAIEQSARA